MDIKNNYKRFQSYQNNNAQENNFYKNYMEQNYKVDTNKNSEKTHELGEKRELSKQDAEFLKNASRLSVNSQGNFIKK